MYFSSSHTINRGSLEDPAMIVELAIVHPLKPTIDAALANRRESASLVVALQTSDRSPIGREAGRAVAADMTAAAIRRLPCFV